MSRLWFSERLTASRTESGRVRTAGFAGLPFSSPLPPGGGADRSDSASRPRIVMTRSPEIRIRWSSDRVVYYRWAGARWGLARWGSIGSTHEAIRRRRPGLPPPLGVGGPGPDRAGQDPRRGREEG